MRILFSALILGGAAMAADVTGVWTGTLSAEGRDHPAYSVLKQDGKMLSGTAGPHAGEQGPIQKGVIADDGSITFELERDGGVMKFKLQLTGDEIRGPVERHRDGEISKGTLALKRQKPDLTKSITALDAELFGAYNACDLAKFRSYFAADVEFYHDKGGLMIGADPVVEATKQNVCGKVRRELTSIEVYPIAGYGAIETGTHKFYNRSSGKEETSDKPAKFLHIWQEKGGEWKVTRVVSYAH